MLPQPVKQNDRGKSQQRQQNGPPFITVEDLAEREITFAIDAVRIVPERAGNFNDIQVRIVTSEKLQRGNEFLMGLKFTDPRYEMLFTGFGRDDEKWKGQSIVLFPHYDDWYKKEIIGMRLAPAAKKK